MDEWLRQQIGGGLDELDEQPKCMVKDLASPGANGSTTGSDVGFVSSQILTIIEELKLKVGLTTVALYTTTDRVFFDVRGCCLLLNHVRFRTGL